jgi:hypothetical protein
MNMAATNKNLVTASWADRSEPPITPHRQHIADTLSQSLDSASNSERVPQVSSQPQTSARFFLIKLNKGSFNNMSPFLIHKSLQTTVGAVKMVKKLRSGELLVEITSSKQALVLLKCSALGQLPVSVSPHGALNFSRGVISEPDLLYTPESEILENLSKQNVSAVRRITVRRDGEVTPTKHLILTFNTPSLPTHIIAGYLRCPVRIYIPNPLRCFKYQRFGHSKQSCRGKLTCARCGEAEHDSESCQKTPHCVNCKGAHPSFYRSCPSWQTEKEVQTLKYVNNMTYAEARKLIQARTPKQNISYSTATQSKSLKTIAIQTEISAFNLHRTVVVDTITPNPKPKVANSTVTPTEKTNQSNHNVNASPMKNTNKKKIKQPKRLKLKAAKSETYLTKKLTKKDFLKNRPIEEELNDSCTNDSLKVYVSAEEDMLTDCTCESEVEPSGLT